MNEGDMRRLIRADEHIQKIVAEFGLDCFPQEFDVIPAQKMLEIMSYHLPVNYSHWSFGRDYEKQRTQYEYMGGIPYEVVLNSNPSRAFLMRTNPYPIQVLVMAHVYGHNDFMKNNVHFRRTRRDMLTSASESASRLRKYEEDYGVGEVERLIDAAHSIQWHSEEEFVETSVEDDNPKPKAPVREAPFSEFFDYDRKQQPKTFDEKREESRKARRRLPAEPESDLLRFIMRHSPRGFEEWELDVLSVIREQAMYFQPQRKTKVMNEGWASFWHMRIMARLFQDGFLTAEEHGFYNLYNSRVLASNSFSLNPYLLGIKTFFNIEERYDKGRFGPEWERDESPDKWSIDTRAGKGLEKLFETRRTHMDWFFLDEFLNKQVVEEAELYIYASHVQGNVEEFAVEETDWRSVKDLVVRSFAHSGIPLIKVLDGDYGGKRELYLQHAFEGLPLDEDYARQTLKHVHTLWDRPVHLETVEVEGNAAARIQWTYDGEGLTKVGLGTLNPE
jgi:stage V sporulation protein R